MPGISEVTYLLPQLEPIFGAGIAVNTAYLSFARFRYRAKIRDQANAELEKIENGRRKPNSEIRQTEYYQRIARLAALKDHDAELPKQAPPQKKPPGPWGWIYAAVFERHHDRKVCWGAVGVAALLLILGVAQEVGLANWSLAAFGQSAIAWSFAVALLSIALPLFIIWMGARVVKSLTDYCNDEGRALAEFLAAQIPEEKLLEDRIRQARYPHSRRSD